MKTEKGRMTKRLLSLLMVWALAAMMLQGCGSKKADEGETKVQEADETQPEEQPAETQEEEPAEELSDTIRWFNASYAVLTELNHWDYNRFGGMEPSEMNRMVVQQLLDEWWGVTDRQTADETLEWIVTEGHRVDFAETMGMLEEDGMGEVAPEDRVAYLLEYYDVTEEEAQIYADGYGAYEQYGANAIAGWDYCRALNLMGYYYIAEYYTLEEALDWSLQMAEAIQPQFESWDQLIDSYMYGYEYWQEASSAERRAVYEELKSRDDNPYAVDFKTSLEKTW
ncbi:MAG: DUF1266 domain-containing protein [Lachnospiraceae bacterium]|jgi:hypothetical protein|nr:DUF1266 domain-containing protein [Lachnospiraceae bacterium]MCI8995677.1 DUF1266 domain-containing protein [Lachnospiraceae bacterium]MCI9133076.1 DUF1266 domain-containing protein [Lachnospiraceae bacterium]